MRNLYTERRERPTGGTRLHIVGSVTKRQERRFSTNLIAGAGFTVHPGYVVASLDKTLYNDYLCLMASNKKQTCGQELKEILGIMGLLKTPKQVQLPLNHEVIIAMKSARIVQQLVASDAVR